MKYYDIDNLENRDPAAIERLCRVIEATVVRYHRAEVRGIERVPAGPVLYVGNHNSFTYMPESYILGAAAWRAHGIDAVPYGLGHEVVLQYPIVNQLLAPVGAVRASHENGERLLGAGKKVLVFPGSDYDALRPFRHRNRVVFGGRRGYMRLALRTRVPIVPVVTAGAHSTFYVIDDCRWLARLLRADKLFRVKVWPLTLSIPWGLTLGPPPPHIPLPSRILQEVLEPISFERDGPNAAADPDWVDQCSGRVQSAMQETLTRLAEELRQR